jgi:chaperonin cofactor prefoldin
VAALQDRRRSTLQATRAAAHEISKSVELEKRISRLELRITELPETVDSLTSRTVSMQAQLDHLTSRSLL